MRRSQRAHLTEEEKTSPPKPPFMAGSACDLDGQGSATSQRVCANGYPPMVAHTIVRQLDAAREHVDLGGRVGAH